MDRSPTFVKISDLLLLLGGEAFSLLCGIFDGLKPSFRACSAFLFLVSHVVRMGAKKQMLRVRAFWVVASMQDMKPLRHIPEMDHP